MNEMEMHNSNAKITNSNVIVIGGGLSGLTSAWEIKKRDPKLQVLVLEAKDRLGGRTLSLPLKTASGEDVWDLGGQWISRDHKNMQQLVSEFQLETYLQFNTGRKLIHLSNDTIKSYSGTIPNLSILTLLDMDRSMKKINKIAQSVPPGNFISHPDAEYYDGMTVETWCNKQMWTDTAVRIVRMAIETMLGSPPSQLSAFYFFNTVSMAGGFDKLIDTHKGGAQEIKIKGGTQQISHLIAERIGMENIHLSEPVVSIKQVNDLVQVTTKSGKVFAAQKLITAIPVHLNAEIEYSPPLPTKKLFLIRNMPMGNLLKIIIVYDKAFWRDKGFSGEILNEGKFEDGYGPIDVVFDATTPKGNPALVGFMSAHRGIFWADAQPEERQQAVLKCLAEFFGDEALTPVSYKEKNWCLEPYNGGCAVSLCTPGLMEFYSTLRIPNGSVHWAGTETSTEFIGYMEGAVSAGKRASLEVLQTIRPDLLTSEEKKLLQTPTPQRRKSQILRQKHKVFRYTIGLALLAVSIVVLKKMYFRIAI